MTTCDLHDWNQPCPTCITAEYRERDHMARRFMLGQTGGSLAPAIRARMRDEWPLKRLRKAQERTGA